MKRVFWLTSLILICGCACFAQQPATDSVPASTEPANAEDTLFRDFSCTVKDHKVFLQWDADSIPDGEYFIIERSNGGSLYETIGALKAIGNVSRYDLTDNEPFNGSNFYRIRYAAKTGDAVYSKTIHITLSQSTAFKFYPNPVDKLLIIQTDHTADIQILSSQGAVRISTRVLPGVHVINVSALEKGSYLLRVTDQESSNRDMLEQLIKN